MKALCDIVRSILMEESNIQPVSSPVTICGDIHGQFWDLLELLRKGGMVPETSYIFMVRESCLGDRPRCELIFSRLYISPYGLFLTGHMGRSRVISWTGGIIVWRLCRSYLL